MVAAVVGAVLSSCSSVPEAYEQGLSAWRAASPETATPMPAGAGAAEGAAAEATAQAEASTAPPDESLNGHLARAARRNASVREAHQLWRAALERVPQVTSLADPRLSVGVFVQEVETRTGPMEWRLGLSQSFPWFGKLDLAGKIAVLRAEAAREQVAERRLHAQQAVRDAWYELAYLAEAVAITQEHLAILSHWEEIARVRYSTGAGGDADVIRAQVELGKLDDRQRTLQDLRRPLEARLNAALDRPAATAVGSPDLHDLPDVTSVGFDEVALVDGLLTSHPSLRRLSRLRDAAELRIELADKEFAPDFSIGVDYTAIGSARMAGTSGSGDDAVALSFGIDLPIRRRRYEAGVAQATAQRSAAMAAVNAAHNELSAELEMAFYRARDAGRRVALYSGTLVPKGRQSIESVLVAYQTDAVDFFELVDAERVLLEFQLAAARARADHAQALARIVRLTGAPLSEDG